MDEKTAHPKSSWHGESGSNMRPNPLVKHVGRFALLISREGGAAYFRWQDCCDYIRTVNTNGESVKTR